MHIAAAVRTPMAVAAFLLAGPGQPADGLADTVAIASFEDRLYLSLARPPDCPGTDRRWNGNLKKLRLGPSGDGELQALDGAGRAALGPTGSIRDDAISLWTDAGPPHLSGGDLNGDGRVEPPVLNRDAPANPPGFHDQRDGGHLQRGGAGQKIPGFRAFQDGPGDTNARGKRRMYFLSSAPARLQALEVSDAVADQLGGRLRAGGYSTETAHAPAFPAYSQRHHVRRLLRYIRGQDVNDEDGGIDAGGAVDFVTRLEYRSPEYTEPRPWLMGDAPHAPPLPISYGAATFENTSEGGNENFSADNPAVFVALASNDGLLRLVRDTTADGIEDGQEIWAFMPDEAMADQERLMSGRAAGHREYPHPYAMDGAPAALVIDRNGNGTVETGDRVLLIVGLRRAGRAYYALDITNPYEPVFLWKVGHAGRLVAGADTLTDTNDFAELGLAFSRPVAGRVARPAAGAIDPGTPAIFFGGGYDGGPPELGEHGGARPGKDHRGPGDDDRIGKAIFVVEAETGKLVWKAVGGATTGPGADRRVFTHAGLRDSIPSSVAVVDTNSDGIHDRILVGDSGGNLWRADLAGDWQLVRLACLGRHGGPGCSTAPGKADDRRFFHEPDLVQVRDGARRYDVVLIGSGDRENLLDRGPPDEAHPDGERRDPVPRNRLYAISDPGSAVGSGRDLDLDSGSLSDVTVPCAGAGCQADDAGWFFDLRQTAPDGTPGEKALSAPVTLDHTVYFTTHVPPSRSAGHCERGTGSLYAVNLHTGGPAMIEVPGADAPPASARHRPLATPGTAAAVQFLGATAAGDHGAGAPGSCRASLLAGSQAFGIPACLRFRTFWQRSR